MSTTLFAWKPTFNTGDALVDTQHRKLVALVSDLHEAMAQGKGNKVLGRILGDLIHYTVEHFHDEEAIMRKESYPKLSFHMRLHADLTRTATKMKTDFDSGRVSLSLDTLNFLMKWLNDHILGADQDFAQWVKTRKAQRN